MSLTISEYQEYVRQGIRPTRKRTEFLTIAFAGEVGEALNEIKHMLLDQEPTGVYYPPSYVRENIIDELGDVLWYYAALCSHLDIQITEIMEHNVEKLNKRYGEDSE